MAVRRSKSAFVPTDRGLARTRLARRRAQWPWRRGGLVSAATGPVGRAGWPARRPRTASGALTIDYLTLASTAMILFMIPTK